jgi:tetratricopeptide (TPR) repeat protein
MRRKIEWYQEVLALEPGSRIFFPLAKLFVELGQLDDAMRTLRQGLDRHPDCMEARLLLIQLLTRTEQWDDATVQLALVTKPLERYPAFWSLWAQQQAETDRDFAVFLMLVASQFTEKPIKWTDVIIEGLASLSERLKVPMKNHGHARKPQSATPAPEVPVSSFVSEEGAYTGPKADAGSYRTRTMADLLASQGDFIGALGIYRELWGRSLNEQEKTELTVRIRSMEDGLAAVQTPGAGGTVPKPEDPFGKHAKNRLMSTLEALANRLEARIQP